MSVLGVILVVAIVTLLVLPMWAIVACDFWKSVVFKEGIKMPYPWAMTLLGPTIMSGVCVGVAHLVNFDTWVALGLCLVCVVNGMMSGLVDVATTKKERECELNVFLAYSAVMVAFIFATMKALSLANW